MKVTKQKNVYYIDISKNLYRGYVETSISLEESNTVYYKYASMDILSVILILEDGTTVKPDIEMFLLRDVLNGSESMRNSEIYLKVQENQQTWEKEMSDILKIVVPGTKKSVTIRIEYQPSEFNTSICFYRPVYEDDKHKELVGVNRQGYSYELFPSVWTENSRTGYSWELTYILPNTEEYKIVSPGLLKSFKEEDKVNISMYHVEEAIPDFINFSVGTYERVEIYNGDDKKVIFVPNNLEEYFESINEAIEDLANILKYVEHFLQRSFPIPTLSLLFSMVEVDFSLGIGTALCNISLLTPFKDIEQAFKIKRTIAGIVSSQIFYFYVHYSDITDFWIFCGMKGYLEDYCVRFLLGNNDFLFNFKEEKDFVFKNDVYELPLCDPRRDFLSYDSEFFKKKSKLIFHTLENNLSKAFLEKMCNFTLKKTNSQIGTNFTHDFIVLIKDVTGKDMKAFFDTYVFAPGLVNVSFRFTIDKKKNRVDFKVEQSSTSKLPGANHQVKGFVNVKSYEVEGSYDHSFNFNQENYFYYHTRTKKKKKPEEEEEEIMPLLWIRIDPKREHLLNGTVEQPDYMFIEQLLDKNVIGQVEAIDYLSRRPSVQICEAFERILENSQMFYKVRIRILYVLAKISIENYIGFQRVIQFFIKKFCVQSSTVIKPNDFSYINYFLQKHSIKALSFTDPFITKNYNGRTVGSASIVCAFMINILRFNDNSMNVFSDSCYIASVIKGLVRPILAIKTPCQRDCLNLESKTECKFWDGAGEETGEQAGEEMCEGSQNNFGFLEEDSSSISEKTQSCVSDSLNYIELATGEVERYRLLDMVFPSHNNIVTESTLYFLGRLAINNCLGIKREVLLSLSSYPNAFHVRKAALNLLLILFPDRETVDFLLGLVKQDGYQIKRVVIEALEGTMASKSIFKDISKEVKEILQSFPYDCVLRNKILNILGFVEGKDVSLSEYNNKLLEYYSTTYDKDFYFKKTMSQSIPKATESIRIRLINFLEMKKEELKKNNRLKIYLFRKDFTPINSYGPTRKVIKEDKEDKEDKKDKIDKEVKKEIDTVKIDKCILEDKIDKSVLDKPVVKVEEALESLEEANIKEMLQEEDPVTEELLTSCVEAKRVSSPFLESKNNRKLEEKTFRSREINLQLTSNKGEVRGGVKDGISESLSELKSNLSTSNAHLNLSTPLNLSTSVRSNPLLNLSKRNEDTVNLSPPLSTPPLKKMKFIPLIEEGACTSLLKGEDTLVEDKKEYLEGLFSKMKRSIDRRIEQARRIEEIGRIEQVGRIHPSQLGKSSLFDLHPPIKVEERKTKESDLLEKILMEEDGHPEDKTLENLLDEDWSSDKLFEERKGDSCVMNNTLHTNNTNTLHTIHTLHDTIPTLHTSTIHANIDIDTFLDDLDVLPFKRISPTRIRLGIGFKIRLRLVKARRRGRKPKNKPELLSSHFYDSRRMTKPQRIYEETVRDVNLKPLNTLILKNRDTRFFSWIPKTFPEIEEMVLEEVGYSSISKELERSLVFILTYSPLNTKTYTTGKKMFDAFEEMRYFYTPIPPEVVEMTPPLKNACVDFLNSLFLNDSFSSFIKPVNTEVHRTYLDIVRFPMCLEIIQKKMNVYRSLDAFFGDLRQILKNCCYFNQNVSEICSNARRLLRHVNDFNRQVHPLKGVLRSQDILKGLLSRFINSSLHKEMVYKAESGLYKTFYELLYDVEKVRESYIRVVMSPQQLMNDIEDFKAQIYYWYNSLEGRSLCFGL